MANRAFQALFPAIHRGPARTLAATRGLGDVTIHGYLGQFQADHPVECFQSENVHHFGYPLPSPLFDTSTDGPVRASGAEDWLGRWFSGPAEAIPTGPSLRLIREDQAASLTMPHSAKGRTSVTW